MSDPSFRRYVLLTNLVVFALTAPLAWLYGGPASITGAVVGNGAGLVNLLAMAWLVGKLVGSGGGHHKAIYGLLLTLKMGAVLGLLAFVVLVLDVEIVGLMIGLSSVVMALVVGGTLTSLGIARSETSSNDASGS